MNELKTNEEVILRNGVFPPLPWKLRSHSNGKWIGEGEIIDLWLKNDENGITILPDCTDPAGKVPQLNYTCEGFAKLLERGKKSELTLMELVQSADNVIDALYVETNIARFKPYDVACGFREKNSEHTIYLFKTKESGTSIVREVYFVLKD